MAQTVIVSWCTVFARDRIAPFLSCAKLRVNVPEYRALLMDQGGDSMGP